MSQPATTGTSSPALRAPWPTLATPSALGLLTDKEIVDAIGQNQLVLNGATDGAKYACYELRIGDRIEELVMDSNGDPQQDIYRAKSVPADGTFRINPGQTFKIYAKESLFIPADVTAFAIPVGILFKLGLNPETTFADPGFQGEFFITVCNYSPRIVRLTVGEPLARLFFVRLAHSPLRLHSGQPRPMPPAVERVPRPTSDDLIGRSERELIEAVLNLVDPPHYEHAFVTQVLALKKFDRMRRDLAILRWVVFVLGAIGLSAVVLRIWGAFSETKPTLAEGTLASILASVVVMGAVWGLPKALAWARGRSGVQR